MGAPTGNQFWKARSSHGRSPKFESPEKLWEACQEYFEWVDNNPLQEMRGTQFQGQYVMQEFPKMRAMTISGLCIFLDIVRSTWDNYRKQDDFLNIITRVEQIIETQKFQGAAADFLNPNIIARDLGLAEKKVHSGELGIVYLDPKDKDA
jgi:hypothetical protein